MAGQEPAVGLGEFDCLGHHPHAAFRCRCDRDLGAEKAHQLAPLDAERLRHRDDERIALLGAHHRQADAGVAARRFDHRLARLELAGRLGVLDHPEGQPILDRAQGIEGLDLDREAHIPRRQLADPDHRGVADRLEDVVELPTHGFLRGDRWSFWAVSATAAQGERVYTKTGGENAY